MKKKILDKILLCFAIVCYKYVTIFDMNKKRKLEIIDILITLKVSLVLNEEPIIKQKKLKAFKEKLLTFFVLGGDFLKLSKETMKLLLEINNAIYDDIKLEFLYHSNKLEGSTFNLEQLNVLLDEDKIIGELVLEQIYGHIL